MIGLFRHRNDLSEPSLDSGAGLATRKQVDRDAFAAIYDLYFDAIYRYCYVRIADRERAEDATHQIFVRALEAFDRYEEMGKLRQWLFAIAHNVVAGEFAARRPSSSIDELGELADPGATPETLAIVATERMSLRTAIDRLPSDQRRAIELRIAGLTGPEIANELGRSHEAVKMLQQRAMNRLKAELRESQTGGGRNGT